MSLGVSMAADGNDTRPDTPGDLGRWTELAHIDRGSRSTSINLQSAHTECGNHHTLPQYPTILPIDIEPLHLSPLFTAIAFSELSLLCSLVRMIALALCHPSEF